MRSAPAAAFVVATGLLASPSQAAKPARACIDEHAQGQVERDAGRLLRASERFRACAEDACPALIRTECGELEATLIAQIPSIVVRAQDAQGRPISGARATIDEDRTLPSLSETPIPVDPGVHQIEVTLADGRRQTVNLSLSEGEKARPAVARFETPKARPVERSGNELAYVIGGAGLLG